jgi:hypothetical protein
MSAPKRREFIPQIRQAIADRAPMADVAVNEAIDSWRDGNEPSHPLEAAIFSMCDVVARDLDERSEDSEAERHPSRGTTADAQDAREFYEAEEAGDRCTNPDGHVWNQSAGEADEARIRRDVENDRIYCLYCGADGDS